MELARCRNPSSHGPLPALGRSQNVMVTGICIQAGSSGYQSKIFWPDSIGRKMFFDGAKSGTKRNRPQTFFMPRHPSVRAKPRPESARDARNAQLRRESLRAVYLPEKVRMLFVGESPPVSGRFFYSRNSGLYRAVRDAFHLVDGSIVDENFLDIFQSAGCYLIDACRHPVDGMQPAARRDACQAGEALLSREIRNLQPDTMVSLLRSIRPNVERAALRASWTGTLIFAPYPGRWIQHRKVFLELLVPHVRALLAS